mgnify:CR=1 FL=1
MNLLITGGCGFIGSNFIRYVLGNSEHQVINYDALTYAAKGKNIQDMGLSKHPNYHFVRGSITNKKRVEKTLREHSIDAVVNFAAESHVDRCIIDDAPFMRANCEGARVLLNASRNCGKIERFVQIGTDEVYGSLSDRDESSTETKRLEASSSYSATKAGADLLAFSFFKTHGLPVCVTRSSNNYGPYQHPEKFIPVVITNPLEGKSVPVYGKGENIREWIHVEDNCRAIYKVLTGGKPGEIYNIGTGEKINNIHLARIILEELGLDEKWIKLVEDRKGHDWIYSLNCDKIKKELGWTPKISFIDGIRKTIRWYKKNENWWRRLKNGKK